MERNIKHLDERYYHGWKNRYPFTDVVAFILSEFGSKENRASVRILDLGCGAAHHLTFLADEGFDYFGVDGAGEAVAISRAGLSSKGHDPDRVAYSDLRTLPYEEGFFDCVIDRGSLFCNRRSEMALCIDEVFRVLKDGGVFYSSLMDRDSSVRHSSIDVGDDDFIVTSGRLKDSGVLHLGSLEDVLSLYGRFTDLDIRRNAEETIFPIDERPELTIWLYVRCRK